MRSSFIKKARLFRAWASRHPIWCAWQVTYRCNFRCRFCGYWHDPMGQLPEPTVEEYRVGTRKLAQWGSMLVSLAGGEPMLRPDLPDIVNTIAEFHLPFVTTNGFMVTEELARDLFAAGLWGVSISIDYATAARHDAARGMDGAWEQAWRAVEMFSKARRHDYQRVNVMGVLLDDNLDDLDTLCQMAAKRGAYFMVQPYGHLKIKSKRFQHAGDKPSEALLDIWKRNRNFLSNPIYLKQFDEYLHGPGIPGCRAGRAFFNIDSTGDIAICVERRHTPVANLFRDSATVIHKRLRAATAHGKNSCTECWYNCRGEVESLYRPKALLHSLPTFFFNRGQADNEGKMGRWS